MTPLVEELAYVVLDTADLDAWTRFAQDILGFEAVRDGANLRLRMDARPYRYLVRQSEGERLPILGWQVADAVTLDTVSGRLGDLGLEVSRLDEAALLARRADGGVRFRCRNGIDHELVHGLGPLSSFVPPGDVTGYVTSPGGLGHVVWSVPDVEAMDRLMIDAFRMTLREDIPTPAGQGHFYGCNARHHSLAVFSAPALRLEHLMVEMADLDDVGRAMDQVSSRAEYEMLQPLGRHRTDHMVSFYVRTPSGFGMEVGYGGLLCDERWADVRDSSRRRPWGHGTAMRAHHKGTTASAPRQQEEHA